MPDIKLDGLILAGGQGSRMGGCDKGWVQLDHKPLVEWSHQALKPLVNQLLISCNRNSERYADLADQVVADEMPDYPGPLAGIQSALAVTEASHLLVMPCDTPWVSRTLLRRLIQKARQHPNAVVVVAAEGRLQPLHAIIPVALKASLNLYLSSGQRAVRRWYDLLSVETVEADSLLEMENINTPQQLVPGQSAFSVLRSS